ncbi:hypothetical protein [Cupriavidus basilensis]|uniref:hypothetical protein n=1 Tax=Cupriavidus basilensis TaxID=68895 RepID=UPI0023E76CC5|nr:hypothetical protein [Cupriavidus basilensis]MDF3883943.1 hypothetical protein [Cupriavidus basilensis]
MKVAKRNLPARVFVSGSSTDVEELRARLEAFAEVTRPAATARAKLVEPRHVGTVLAGPRRRFVAAG